MRKVGGSWRVEEVWVRRGGESRFLEVLGEGGGSFFKCLVGDLGICRKVFD